MEKYLREFFGECESKRLPHILVSKTFLPFRFKFADEELGKKVFDYWFIRSWIPINEKPINFFLYKFIKNEIEYYYFLADCKTFNPSSICNCKADQAHYMFFPFNDKFVIHYFLGIKLLKYSQFINVDHLKSIGINSWMRSRVE